MSYPLELLHNGAQLRLVGVHPTAKTAFYVNNGQGGVVGVRVYPDGRQAIVNATDCKRCGKHYAHGNAEYLQFRDAWGFHLHILASHAVFIAWCHEIPAGMTIDHINGVTTDNFIGNLRCVTMAVNGRDGGFLRKLRNKGFNPAVIQRHYLLRYYDRMAHIKANISLYRYQRLDRADLMTILFYDIPVVYDHFKREYNIELPVISNF